MAISELLRRLHGGATLELISTSSKTLDDVTTIAAGDHPLRLWTSSGQDIAECTSLENGSTNAVVKFIHRAAEHQYVQRPEI